MSEFSGFYALWQRELKIYLRERSRIVSSAINPLLWLFVFGAGLGSSVSVGEANYQTFIYPGIIVMTVIFSSIFYGAYVVWDKRLDFLKEVLVSPIRRSTVFLGKVMGGTTDGIIQATIMLILAPIFGIKAGLAFALVYLFLFILVVGLVSVGLVIGSLMESPEGFGLLSSFVTFPLFFLSGALFPLTNLPAWLSAFTVLNPVTYGVDAIRGLMLGTYAFGLLTDFAVLVGFAMVMIALGTLTFRRMKL
jgi:ABC-2 type transport system permease protein